MFSRNSVQAITLVSVLCFGWIACVDRTNKQPPSTSASPTYEPTPTAEASGGFAPREMGDTAPEEFAGTAGIVEKRRSSSEVATLRDVRIGRHEKFDRIVFEFAATSNPGYHVEYVDRPVRACGSGEVVELAGDGYLLIQMQPARAHTDAGEPTVTERDRTVDLPVLRQAKLICDFEADVQWAIGLSKPNRYRVLELKDPSRLVVDIKH